MNNRYCEIDIVPKETRISEGERGKKAGEKKT